MYHLINEFKKLIPGIRNLNYENRLRKLELTDRRLRRKLIQIFKIMKLSKVRGHCFTNFK